MSEKTIEQMIAEVVIKHKCAWCDNLKDLEHTELCSVCLKKWKYWC